MENVELVGRNGERVGEFSIAGDPGIVALGSRHFIRDDVKFYAGKKYVEVDYYRIEQRKEGAVGTEADRKAAGAGSRK